MVKIISEEEEKERISKMRRKVSTRILEEIHNEFNVIIFSLKKISKKLGHLKEFETKYNKSVPKIISLIIKNLKKADSFYLRDDRLSSLEEINDLLQYFN